MPLYANSVRDGRWWSLLLVDNAELGILDGDRCPGCCTGCCTLPLPQPALPGEFERFRQRTGLSGAEVQNGKEAGEGEQSLDLHERDEIALRAEKRVLPKGRVSAA